MQYISRLLASLANQKILLLLQFFAQVFRAVPLEFDRGREFKISYAICISGTKMGLTYLPVSFNCQSQNATDVTERDVVGAMANHLGGFRIETYC